MRTPNTRLYLHCVWATWNRLPLIGADIETRLYSAIAAKCRQLDCEPLAIGGGADHVHLLVRLKATVSVASLLKEVKGASSHLATHEISPGKFFKWQGSYGAFTVGADEVSRVAAYIARQKEHHATRDVWEEWERLDSPDGSPRIESKS